MQRPRPVPQSGLARRAARVALAMAVGVATLGLTTVKIAGQRDLGGADRDRRFEQGVLRGPGAWLGVVRETLPGWVVTATVAREGLTWDIELTVELPASSAPNADRTGPSDGQDELVAA